MAITLTTSSGSNYITCTASGWGSETVTQRRFVWCLNGIEKYDTGWVSASSSYSYTFSNLSPGTYSPSVHAYTPNGWNSWYYFDDVTISYPSDSAVLNIYPSYDSVVISLTGITSRSYTRTARCNINGVLKTKTISAYNTSCTFDTFTGLTPNTTYTVDAGIRVINDDVSTRTWRDNSQSFTTVYPSDSATIIYTVGLTSIKVKLTNITSRPYTRTARCIINNTLKTVTISAGDTETAYMEFTGLSEDTQYTIDAGIRVVNDDVNTRTWRDNSKTATTINSRYVVSFSTSSTYNSVTATVTLNAKQVFDIDLTVYIDDDRALEIDIAAGNLSRTRTWSTDILPATSYKITLKDKIKNETRDLVRRTKNNFHWSDSKWNMNVSKNEDFYINHDAWNEYTSQLSAKASYYDITYNPATVKTGDQLTAEKYNNIAATINKMVNGKKGDCKTKVSTVSAGDPVTAYSINILETCLNE